MNCCPNLLSAAQHQPTSENWAAVGTFFSPEANQRLFREFGWWIFLPHYNLSLVNPLFSFCDQAHNIRYFWPHCFKARFGGSQADSLSCQGARGFPSQVKLGVSGLHCLTALFPHWPCCQPTSPIGRASAPAQDFPAKEGRHRWCQPCRRLSLPATFLRRKKTLVSHLSWS